MQFLTEDLWPEIRKVARDRGPRYVAVPFLPSGAFSRLSLKRRDVLVIRFDDATIKNGQTDPREVLKYLRAGVEVHNNSVLHAKVYVSARRAVVCSANLSAMSEGRLAEAGIVSKAQGTISQAKRFVLSMRGDVVEPAFAKSRVPLYKPPIELRGRNLGKKRGRSIPRVHQSPIWLLITESAEYDTEDRAAEKRGYRQARKRQRDRNRYKLESISWSGRLPVKVGDRVICVDGTGRARLVEAPSRAIAVSQYAGSRHGKKTMVTIEVRKFLRPRRVSAVRRQLGAIADDLARVHQSKKLRSPKLLYSLGRLWPTT